MSQIIRLCVLSLAIASALTLVHAQTAEWRTNDSHSFVSEALPAVPTPKLISLRKPDGMILSTGNLYFTSHDATSATVWRTSQTSTPGQERALFREVGATFGDICFAKVDGAFFGYFFASNAAGLTIRRVSLTGGPATVLTTIPANNVDITNTHHNLITDGLNLYWQDDSAIRKIPIRGGPVTVIDPSNPNTPTAGIAFQNRNIIYASVAQIRFVPPNGSSIPPSSRIIVTAPTTVATLHAVSNGVYWGDRDGAVKRKVGTTITTLQSNGSHFPSSISSTGPNAGGTEAWTECIGSQCRLHLKRPFFVDLTLPVAGNPFGVTVRGRQVFWGDNAGVHRMAF